MRGWCVHAGVYYCVDNDKMMVLLELLLATAVVYLVLCCLKRACDEEFEEDGL